MTKQIKLTTEEAAVYLDIHPSTLATWRWKGKSPKYYRFPTGGKLYYLKEDLDKWLNHEGGNV